MPILTDQPVEGGEVRSRRRAAGLTQRELAARCGVTQVTISHIEVGHTERPHMPLLLDMADTLQCAVEDLLVKASTR